MDYKIPIEELKEKILNDEYLMELFKREKFDYQHYFKDVNFWTFQKSLFIDYFTGVEALCTPYAPAKRCKQEIKGRRVIIEVYNNWISPSVTDCNCILIDNLETFYYYYDFPKKNLTLNFGSVPVYYNVTRVQSGFFEYCNEMGQWLAEKIPFLQGVYIYSKKQTGKTFITTILANQVAIAKKSVTYIKMNKLIRELSKFDNIVSEDFKRANYVNPKNFQRICIDATVLVIDNIGTGNLSSWVRDGKFTEILEDRFENEKLTIFTSNLSPQQLAQWFLDCSKAPYSVKEQNGIRNIIKLIFSNLKIMCWDEEDIDGDKDILWRLWEDVEGENMIKQLNINVKPIRLKNVELIDLKKEKK